MKVKLLSRVRLFATPWTVAHQVPLSMGFPRQEYWSGLPFPSPEGVLFIVYHHPLEILVYYSSAYLTYMQSTS